MKIMVLADEPDKRLWDYLDKSRLDGIDLILSCGDLPAAYLSFLTCFTTAPIVYVPGNHDKRYEQAPPEGCICADDDIVTACGLRILGLGGCMRYGPGPHMYTEKEMQKRIKGLKRTLRRHDGFDILLTHAPMAGLGDMSDLAHRGFECFRPLLEKYHPPLFVFAHVHGNYSSGFKRTHQYADTTAVNAWISYVLEYPGPAPTISRKKTLWERLHIKRTDPC